jgi:hypothetical protein
MDRRFYRHLGRVLLLAGAMGCRRDVTRVKVEGGTRAKVEDCVERATAWPRPTVPFPGDQTRGDQQSDGRRSRPLVRDGDAVFFVGNSFFDFEGRRLPEWISALGATLSPPIHLRVGGDILPGDTPLSEFLAHPATQEALASRKYRVFVIQGQDDEPVDHKRDFQQAVSAFHRAIEASGAKTVLFMTWDFPDRHFLKELADSYEEIGRELDIPVIPVGLIYNDCAQTHPLRHGRYWLTATPAEPQGDLHENAMGSAVNTYATFAMLTAVNPRGMNFVAPGNTNSDALMRSLSDMAWAWVLPRLNPGPAAPAASLHDPKR